MSKVLVDREDFAHELWLAAQLAPGEGILDGVARIVALLPQPADVEGVGVVAEVYSHRSRDSMRVAVMNIQQIGRLRAEVDALREDAAAGSVVWGFIDRMADPAECDPAENILNEFVDALDAAMAAKEA